MCYIIIIYNIYFTIVDLTSFWVREESTSVLRCCVIFCFLFLRHRTFLPVKRECDQKFLFERTVSIGNPTQMVHIIREVRIRSSFRENCEKTTKRQCDLWQNGLKQKRI